MRHFEIQQLTFELGSTPCGTGNVGLKMTVQQRRMSTKCGLLTQMTLAIPLSVPGMMTARLRVMSGGAPAGLLVVLRRTPSTTSGSKG